MALVKVLALDATGVIETEIDTGSGGSGGAAALDDLTDVIITSAVTDDVLKWNGTNWVNGTAAGGGGAPLTNPQFTAYVGIGTPANADYALNMIKDLTYQGTFGVGFDSSEAGIMLRTNVPAQTPGTGNPFTSGITNYKTIQLQTGANNSFNTGISNVLTSTAAGLRDTAKDYLTGIYNRVIAAGTDAVNTAIGALTGIQNNVVTTGANQVIDSMTGMISAATLTSGNSATTMVGLSTGAQCPTGATATTLTGINVSLVLSGTYTNAWSINSPTAGATMYHAGKISVGGSSRVPTELMDVAGYITANTPPVADNSKKLATTAFVVDALASGGLTVGKVRRLITLRG